MDQNGTWRMSPAYDLTYSSTGIDEHITRVAGEVANPGRSHLIELARHFSINKPNEIIDQVQEALSHWPRIASEWRVSKTSTKRIEAKLNELRD